MSFLRKNKQFCCDQFTSYYEKHPYPEVETYPNIKIIKLEPDHFNKGKYLYRYYLVSGFVKDKPPFIVMKFCPFCGVNLFKFYNSDNYINADYRDYEHF